jgi:hypothetical protein
MIMAFDINLFEEDYFDFEFYDPLNFIFIPPEEDEEEENGTE